MSSSLSTLQQRGLAAVALAPWVIGVITGIDYFDNALFAFFASYIAGGVSASADELVWASSAYALGAVLGILQQHAWVERIGYRRYLAISMFAFAAGGVFAALSDNSVQLMFARGFQGYFVGPMLGACRILIQIGIPLQRRAKSLRAFMAMIIFGGALAPIVGAWLVTHFEWRSLFFCTAPVAVITGALALWTLPDIGDVAPHQRTEPHYVAYIVFALAQAALQLVLTRAHFELFSGSPTLIGLAVAGLGGLGWFGYHQWKHPAPLVRLQGLREASFQVGLALYVVYYCLSTGFSYLLPRMMEGGLGFTVGDTGYFTGVMSLVGGLMMFVYMKFSSRVTRKRWLVVPGFVIAAVAGFWLARMSPQAGRAQLVVPLLLRGLMMLFVMLPVAGVTFRAFKGEDFAHSYRLKNLLRQLAISFATASVIALQQHRVALHETRLGESASLGNATFAQSLDMLTRGFQAAGHAANEAHTMALASLSRMLEQQATFMASLDGFQVMAVIAIVAAIYAASQKVLD
ncbi:MFS transporter [Variovorax ureilyticus]|uniref:MFS transporter n=1 Tax=Variovorax ureilyticus TaxID=1836198 RepID=A0ABU8VFG7_9BURK